MKTVLIVVAAYLAPTGFVLAQSYAADCQRSATARELCDTEVGLTEALRRNEATRLAEIYADDFQLVNFRGRQLDKPAVLAAIRSGSLRFDALSTSDLQLRLYGDAAVITGRQHQVAREPGADAQAHPKDVRFTHVYVRRSSRWYLVSSHITPIL